MTPFPLMSAEGVVYAYACGVCHQVPAGGKFLHRQTAIERIGERAEASRSRAERCCRCMDCTAPLEDEPLLYSQCRACHLIEVNDRKWRSFAGQFDNIAEAIRLGITTEEAWVAHWHELLGDDDE